MREQIEKYVNRANHIQSIRERLSELETKHAEMSRSDFGLTDGDIVTVETLVTFYNKISEIQKKEGMKNAG